MSRTFLVSFCFVSRAEVSIVCMITYLEQQKVLSMNEPPVQYYRKQKKDSFQHYLVGWGGEGEKVERTFIS